MNTEQYKKLAIKLLNESSASGNKEIIVPVGQKQLFSYAPSSLYKYCRINEYTILNIVNDQFYIAPLDMLDDQFEVRLSFRSDFARYYQEVMTYLKKSFPDKLKKSEIITEEQLADYLLSLKTGAASQAGAASEAASDADVNAGGR
ncbi:MAG: hypothetical protein Q4D71_10800 [Oscillospiraceae bacterium]|nr:hypothetical protein [Oscillospiraceae bacterium]